MVFVGTHRVKGEENEEEKRVERREEGGEG